MGTWGNGVWQDDVAQDVILRFETLLGEGSTPREAVHQILVGPPWGWGDPDDDGVQTLALAALALQRGVLDAALRDRTIVLIESDGPRARWTDAEPAAIAARQAVLERFKALLLRGTATVEEFASVTEPAAFSLW